MTDKEIYKAMKKNALDDTKEYKGVEYDGCEPFVEAEIQKDGVWVFDADEAPFEREYIIRRPDKMTKKWLSSLIVATPSALSLGINIMSAIDWIYKKLPKYLYCTLERIIFVGGLNDDEDEADFDFLCGYGDGGIGCNLEEHNLPSDRQLGISWVSANTVVVHIGHIVNYTKNMVDDGELYEWEKSDCVNNGVAVTLIHELRHLAQNNPYIPEEVFCFRGRDLEADAEEYAREFVDENPVFLL